jgi:hypothetical protein
MAVFPWVVDGRGQKIRLSEIGGLFVGIGHIALVCLLALD